MARQVLPIIGAVVGGAIGGPTGAQIGFAIGSIVGNAVDPQVIKGPKIGEAGLQTSAEGVYRPIIFGTGAVKGNIIARGNRQVRTQRTSQGKGGGPVTEEQRVYWTFAIRICEGPISGITRVWQDEKLVYDIRPGSTIPEESSEFATRFRLYLGDEDQLPDPDLEAYQGMGNSPAYRGSAYAVFPNFDLTDGRERIPEFRWEVATSGGIITAGAWISGPVAENDAAGGSERFYRTSNSPIDWYAGQLHPLPVWFGSLSRISAANGVVFLHSGIGSNAAVSFNKGVTFEECNGGITDAEDVYYNGTKYYCGGRTSSDGITWTAIPNLGANHIATCCRPGVVVTSHPGLFRVSINDGATWTNKPIINGWDPIGQIRTDGSTDFAVTLDSTRGYYTTDDFTNFFPSPAVGSAPFFTAYHNAPDSAANIWLRKGFNGRLWRSDDGGDDWDLVLIADLGSAENATVANGTGLWMALEFIGGSPQQWRVRTSTSGVNWDVGQTLYGDNGNVAFIGGGAVSPPGTPVALGDIVATLHQRIGQDATQYDVSELTDQVEGLVLAGDYTAADAIRTLMAPYFFDSSEYDDGSGYRIHYPKRGKPVVTTITIDDLIDVPDETVREDGLERPLVLHLHYENPDVGYAPAKASVRRNTPDVKVVGERSVQIPVTFADVDQPARIADKLMRVVWVEIAGEETFVVHDGLIGLVPGDCIGVSLRGQVRRMRIGRQMIRGGRIEMKLIADRQSAYTSNVTGVPVPPPTPPLPSIVGQTLHEFLDIPALNDNDDRLIWYEAASGQTEAWYGAQTQRKVLSSVEFENSARFTQHTIMGTLLDNVASASEHYTDTTNTVSVQLVMENDVIESLTDAQFLSEGGAFALERLDGSWEILQYRDASDIGGGQFDLTHLARGRLNTGATTHLAGARFVLLDFVLPVDAVTAWIDTTITMRAVSFGTSPDGVPQTPHDYGAASQTEFPVAHLFLDLAGSTLTANTVPRHRFGTEDNPVRSINWTGYRWTATDGVNTISVDGISDTQVFDVTGWATPITVTVAQINRFTGPGPTVSEDIS